MAEAKRTLVAILAADVAGYSRLMGDDERATMNLLSVCRDVFRKHISDHEGRVVDTAGDSVLATFQSVVEAVDCAVDVQRDLVECNNGLPDSRQMLFRIGVNLGDVIEQDDGTVYGDGVNVAARLEGLATPGGLVISESAHMQIEGKNNYGFVDAGNHEVKNISRPIRAFMWADDDGDIARVLPRAFQNDHKPTIALAQFEASGKSDDAKMLAEGVRDSVSASLSNQTGMILSSAIDQADYVVSVRIQLLNGRYRATLQVLDRQSDHQFSSDRFEGDFTDIFEAQDQLAYRLYSSARFAIYGREAAKTLDRPDLEQSNEALLTKAGHHMFSADSGRYADGVRMTEVILGRDPNNFMALAIKARAHLAEFAGGYRDITRDDAAAAIDSARKAVQLNPQSEVSHVVLSFVLLICFGEFEEAEDAAKRSLELNPSYAVAMFHLGMVLIYSGRAKEGINLCIKAADANPHGPLNHRYMWNVALGYFALENFSESIEWARRSDQEMPDVAPTLMILTSAAAHAGQADKARRTAGRLISLYPDFKLGALRRWPFRDPEVWARFVSGLELAGLNDPENLGVS